MPVPFEPPLSDFRYFARRETYLAWLASSQQQEPRRASERPIAERLKNDESPSFYCHAHRGQGTLVHSAHAITDHGYYWRESGACGTCGAITRVRLAAEWFVRAAVNLNEPRIYVTEQLTPLYKALRNTFPAIIGSEFVPADEARETASVTLGHFLNEASARIRHEDVCALSFGNDALDLIGSFDVLEHVPDYHAALFELHRVLAPGGQLLLTAPFLDGSATTLLRARLVDGEVEHIEAPEFHGNPTAPGDGVLCFYHFGWDLLDALRNIGFESVALLSAWGEQTAILGAQCAIVAKKK